MKEFLKRLAVAAIAIPFAIYVIYLGKLYLLAAVQIISSMTLWEYYKLIEKKDYSPMKLIGVFLNLFLIGLTYISSLRIVTLPNNLLMLFFAMSGVLVFASGLFKNKDKIIFNTATSLSGIIYISLPFACLIFLREGINPYVSQGIAYELVSKYDSIFAGIILSIFISVWICDTFAYFTGKSIGRHKLMPAVSPKKTWEGAIGGFLGAILAFIVSAKILAPGLAVKHSIIIGAIIGIVGQLGDLAESKIKREAGVKDSSNLIPGHGGMLDRFDSILFVFPIITFYFLIFVGLPSLNWI